MEERERRGKVFILWCSCKNQGVERLESMVTNFIDANGQQKDDRCILIGFHSHAVRIVEMEAFLVDLGDLDKCIGSIERRPFRTLWPSFLIENVRLPKLPVTR